LWVHHIKLKRVWVDLIFRHQIQRGVKQKFGRKKNAESWFKNKPQVTSNPGEIRGVGLVNKKWWT